MKAEGATRLAAPARPTSLAGARAKSTPQLLQRSTHSPPAAGRLAHSAESDTEEPGAEVRSIMQSGLGLVATPPTTFLGVSPPRRSAGACNPLVQGGAWRSHALVSSHSNLQALREIDARGESFLADGARGGSPLLPDSFPGRAAAGQREPPPPPPERCVGPPRTRVTAKPLTCQVGFNVA